MAVNRSNDVEQRLTIPRRSRRGLSRKVDQALEHALSSGQDQDGFQVRHIDDYIDLEYIPRGDEKSLFEDTDESDEEPPGKVAKLVRRNKPWGEKAVALLKKEFHLTFKKEVILVLGKLEVCKESTQVYWKAELKPKSNPN